MAEDLEYKQSIIALAAIAPQIAQLAASRPGSANRSSIGSDNSNSSVSSADSKNVSAAIAAPPDPTSVDAMESHQDLNDVLQR